MQKILKEREVFKTTSELLDLLYFKDGNYLSVDSAQTQSEAALVKIISNEMNVLNFEVRFVLPSA